MDETDVTFDSIMQNVGYGGRFQKMYNMIFVMGLTLCGSMTYLNLILALNVPEHWCHVPGQQSTNLTLSQWKNLTLPLDTDNRGQMKTSSCRMYNASVPVIFGLNENSTNTNFSNDSETTACLYGYEYDREWYDDTIATKEDWVCEKDLNVANTFVISRVAEVAGTFVFGQLGDTIGRRWVFLISLSLIIIGRIISILTTWNYTWFSVGNVIGSIAISTYFYSPFVVSMEISQEDERTKIAMMQSVGWSVGAGVLPFFYWIFRDWMPFMWLTSLLCAVVIVFHKYLIESPRWLIGQRKFGEALVQLKKIAKINHRKFEMTEAELAEKHSTTKKENVYGILSLLSGWRIARTTIIMAFMWCVVSVSYFTLVLFSAQMGGNPFMNFFIQNIVEVPAYVVGKFSGDKIGRRFTNCFSFLLSAVVCALILIFAKDPKYELLLIGAATFIKFLNGITFFAVNLQAMETYPTCLRQTGLSLGAISSNAVGVLAPYFVYLGTAYDIRYPYYILLVLFILGGFGGLLLPETLHQKLPDSLEEAKVFGKDQKFWGLPKAPRKISDTINDVQEKEKLNVKN